MGTPEIKNRSRLAAFHPVGWGLKGEGGNHPTTHVEACTEMSRDAGSIPAASIRSRLVTNRYKSAFLLDLRCVFVM